MDQLEHRPSQQPVATNPLASSSGRNSMPTQADRDSITDASPLVAGLSASSASQSAAGSKLAAQALQHWADPGDLAASTPGIPNIAESTLARTSQPACDASNPGAAGFRKAAPAPTRPTVETPDGFASTLADVARGRAPGADLALPASPLALRAAQRFAPKGGGVGTALGHAATFANVVFPLVQGEMQAHEYETNGDAYSAVVAGTVGMYRTRAALASAGTGAVAGSYVEPGWGTLVGAGTGMVSGLLYDKVAIEMATEAANHDPQKLAQAANLQAQLNRQIISPKVDGFRDRANGIQSNTAGEHLSDSIQKGAPDVIAGALAFETAVRQMAPFMSPEDLGSYVKSYNTTVAINNPEIKTISNSPINKQEASEAESILYHTKTTREFLQARPVPQNDAQAQKESAQLLSKLDEAEKKAKLVLGSHTLGKQLNSMPSLAERIQVERTDQSIAVCEGILAENQKRYEHGIYDHEHTPDFCYNQSKIMKEEIERLKSHKKRLADNAEKIEQSDRDQRDSNKKSSQPKSPPNQDTTGKPQISIEGNADKRSPQEVDKNK